MTPLHHSVKKGLFKISLILIKYGAVINAEDFVRIFKLD